MPLSVGSGVEFTIRELAETIAKLVGYEAHLNFDARKPDCTPRRMVNSGRLHALEDGIEQAYGHWLENDGQGA